MGADIYDWDRVHGKGSYAAMADAMSATGHRHLWKRGPVTDFTVTYTCGCGEKHKTRWASVLPHVSAVDKVIIDAYGGTVTGDSGQPFEYTLSHWMLEIDKLGLRLHTEEPPQDGEG